MVMERGVAVNEIITLGQKIYHFERIPEFIPYFFPAAAMTFKITAAGIAIGLILGLITAFLKISKYRFLSAPASFYVYVIRGTPLLLQLWLFYFGLARVLPMEGITAAAFALGLHNGGYIAEIFRGAIISIDKGQMEAARSLGMTYFKAMRRIILPQAFKRSIPPLGNQFIIALKDSSLASTIAVPELLLKSRQLGSSNFLTLEMLTAAAIFYLLFTTVLYIVVGRIEYRLQVSDR